MKNEKTTKVDLTKNLKALSEIAEWFEQQENIDVEEGLKKVKIAAGLIKESKKRLSEVENEFEELKKNISEEIDEEETIPDTIDEKVEEELISKDNNSEDEVKLEDIPF